MNVLYVLAETISGLTAKAQGTSLETNDRSQQVCMCVCMWKCTLVHVCACACNRDTVGSMLHL